MTADCAITRFGYLHLHTQEKSAIAVSACLHWWCVVGSNVVTAISHVGSVGLLCANTECTHSWALTVCERLLWNKMSYPEDHFRDPFALTHVSSHKLTWHLILQAILFRFLTDQTLAWFSYWYWFQCKLLMLSTMCNLGLYCMSINIHRAFMIFPPFLSLLYKVTSLNSGSHK